MRLGFTAIHELGVLAFFSFFGLVLLAHRGSGIDYSIFTLRGSRTRLWHETTPPVPMHVRQLEARLKSDLDAFEKKIKKQAGIKPSQRMPWNKNIWQSWRNEDLHEWRDTWTRDNPDWDYKLVLDDNADTLIRSTYADVPDVLEIWGSLTRPVIKADLFRYLVIYAYGGLYTDVDTTSSKPLDEWLTPKQWMDPAIHSVIGLTAVGFEEAFMELVQWTFLARPLSPLIRTALITSITNIRRQADQQNASDLSSVNWSFETVLKATGPVAFTEFCLRSIRKETRVIDETFFWGLVYDQTEPIQAGGTVVLPIRGGWRGRGGGAPDDYFKHHNQASWVEGITKPPSQEDP